MTETLRVDYIFLTIPTSYKIGFDLRACRLGVHRQVAIPFDITSARPRRFDWRMLWHSPGASETAGISSGGRGLPGR